jgi:hypothetical protein
VYTPGAGFNLTRKSKPEYNNQELGTTKARRTAGSPNLWFAAHKGKKDESVPKPIDCAPKRTVLDQARAVFQAKARGLKVRQNRVF